MKQHKEFDWTLIVRASPTRVASEQVRLFEKELGFALPEDYRSFLLVTNGGKVIPEHIITLPTSAAETYVAYFYPLSAPSPSIGLVERRKIQMLHRQALEQSLVIGDDMGTGSFFLILGGENRGCVYFCFDDEIPTCEGDWYAALARIPKPMEMVAESFTGLCKRIMSSPRGASP